MSSPCRTARSSTCNPIELATARAVEGWSPVSMITRMPARRQATIASGTSARGGSWKRNNPRILSGPSGGPPASIRTRSPRSVASDDGARNRGRNVVPGDHWSQRLRGPLDKAIRLPGDQAGDRHESLMGIERNRIDLWGDRTDVATTSWPCSIAQSSRVASIGSPTDRPVHCAGIIAERRGQESRLGRCVHSVRSDEPANRDSVLRERASFVGANRRDGADDLDGRETAYGGAAG